MMTTTTAPATGNLRVTKKDHQKARCYEWETAILPPEKGPDEILLKQPFEKEFLEFYEGAWAWGCEHFGYYFYALPPLRFSARMTRCRGFAGYVRVRKNTYKRGIKLGLNGITKQTLLHEMAHLFVFWKDRVQGHGPLFCRAALDLYVKFLGVDEQHSIKVAHELGVLIGEKVK